MSVVLQHYQKEVLGFSKTILVILLGEKMVLYYWICVSWLVTKFYLLNSNFFFFRMTICLSCAFFFFLTCKTSFFLSQGHLFAKVVEIFSQCVIWWQRDVTGTLKVSWRSLKYIKLLRKPPLSKVVSPFCFLVSVSFIDFFKMSCFPPSSFSQYNGNNCQSWSSFQ